MSGSFTAASSHRLDNTTPIVTGVPFTVGAWVYPTTTAAGVGIVYSMRNDADDGRFQARRNGTGWEFLSFDAGSNKSATVTSSATANQWHYIMGRYAATNARRGHVIAPTGAILSASNATSSTPTAQTFQYIGSPNTSTFGGFIAELTVWDVNVWPNSGENIPDSLLRQIAYGGPFSVPRLVPNIVEYRPLRVMGSDQDQLGETFISHRGLQVWTNSGVTLGPHPPLPGGYADLRQSRPIGIV